MDDKFANAMLTAMAKQREAALNAAAQLEAQLSMSLAENGELKQKITELTMPVTSDDTKPDPKKA